MTEQRPDLQSVTRDGDDIVLRGSTLNATFYTEQRIAKTDFSLFVEDAIGIHDVWDAMERIYQELVAGTLYSDEVDVEIPE